MTSPVQNQDSYQGQKVYSAPVIIFGTEQKHHEWLQLCVSFPSRIIICALMLFFLNNGDSLVCGLCDIFKLNLRPSGE